ncbi:bifunctional arginine demethylase and lysyl-hydroxylase JMJD6-like [Pocillopora verrucosa]|uniref:bifunctional arginine demethylase and lysyl-hydroxylase JMJD6-like n=1 Tax=Pocillopora verrucosa TaxID=203993 RepID=UPI0033408A18
MADSRKVDDLAFRFSKLREKCIRSGESIENIRWEFLRDVHRVPKTQSKENESSFFAWNKIIWFLILPAIALLLCQLILEYNPDSKCLIEPDFVVLNEMARKPTNCSLLCEGVNEIQRVSNLSKEEFISTYAYSGRPVVITDAAQNWSAVGAFSFKFFKRLYAKSDEADLDNVDEGCMFFAYKSGFQSLADALRMSNKRAQWKGKPWYIGWSNCDPNVRQILRKYYDKPYFIPHDAETGDQDWIFMGGPGPGAPIHIDMVQRPSWQAQLSGQKMWTLIPPPECEHVCKTVQVTMQKGEIIVLDTNQWFHSTKIIPTGELSITIGAEYD